MKFTNIGEFLDKIDDETLDSLREKYETYIQGKDFDNEKAMYYLKRMADEYDDVNACRDLAINYNAGELIEEDFEKAKYYFEKAIEKGDVESLYELAYMYIYGNGVDKDVGKGFNLIKQAADKGHREAQYRIGKMLSEGVGCDLNVDEAVKYLTMAANQGDEYAVEELKKLENVSGYNWLKEDATLNSYKQKSVDELEKMANSDDVYAMHALASAHQEGVSIKKDNNKAFTLFEKAARLGFIRGLNSMAICYLEGLGIHKDVDKALEMFEYVYQQNCYIAGYYLGYIYETYKKDGNLVKAIEYYQQAAKNGEELSSKRLQFYKVGVNDKIPSDFEQRFKETETGNLQSDNANEGNDESTNQEQEDVSKLLNSFGIDIGPIEPISYEDDPYKVDEDFIEKLFEKIRKEPKPKKIGCKKADVEAWNKEQAKIKDYGKYNVNKLMKLTEENDPYAMYVLANIYYERNDDSLSEDRCNAVNLYAKSAYYGLISAFHTLGYCYGGSAVFLMGDTDKEIELYEYAACHGCLSSFTNLALIYSLGTQVEQDTDKAVELYKQAINFGSVKALNMLGNDYMEGYIKAENEWSGISLGVYYTSEAARKGHVEAQVRLAKYYNEHNRTEEAIQWLTEAIKKDDEQALLLLGEIYERHDSVHLNYKKAFNSYKRAADLGNPWACVKCGEYHLYGKGVEVDYKKAIEFFNKASLPDADAYLGICQLNGYGVPKNVQQGFDTLLEASHQYSDIASGELGMIYYEGKYTKVDYNEALRYFNKILYPELENIKYTIARKAIEDMKCPHCGEFAQKVEKKSLFSKKIYCSKCNQLWE